MKLKKVRYCGQMYIVLSINKKTNTAAIESLDGMVAYDDVELKDLVFKC